MARLIRAISRSDLIASARVNESDASFALYCSSSATPMLLARYAASRLSKADCSLELSARDERILGELNKIAPARIDETISRRWRDGCMFSDMDSTKQPKRQSHRDAIFIAPN